VDEFFVNAQEKTPTLTELSIGSDGGGSGGIASESEKSATPDTGSFAICSVKAGGDYLFFPRDERAAPV